MSEKIVAVIATPETTALLEDIGRGDVRLVFIEPGMPIAGQGFTAVVSDRALSAEDQVEAVEELRTRLAPGGLWVEFEMELRNKKEMA